MQVQHILLYKTNMLQIMANWFTFPYAFLLKTLEICDFLFLELLLTRFWAPKSYHNSSSESMELIA